MGVPAEYPSGIASDGDLANKFIDFFGEKITVLRNSLDSTSDIVVESDAIFHQFTLSCFMSVTLSDVSELHLSYDPYGPARAFIAKLLRKSPYEGRTRWREPGRKKPSGPARIAYGPHTGIFSIVLQ